LLIARGIGPSGILDSEPEAQASEPAQAKGDSLARASGSHRPDIGRVFADGTPIDEAIEEAGRAAAIEHKRAGLSLVIWKRGRVAYIPPEAINDDGTIQDDEPDDETEPGPSRES